MSSGRVADVLDYPANDVLELDSGTLLPLVEACVRQVDLEGGRIVVSRLRRPVRMRASTSSPSPRTRIAWMTEQQPIAGVLGGELELRLFNYRDTTPLRAGQVDDTPYGGGAGMVLRVDVVAAALEAAYGAQPAHRVIALTPQGRPLTQAVVEELARRTS